MLMICYFKDNAYLQSKLNMKTQRVCQNASGKGPPSKNDLNNTSDLLGCEKGASYEAPLRVVNERILLYP